MGIRWLSWNLCSRPDLVMSLGWSSSAKVSGLLAVHQEHGGREPWAEPSWYLFLLANTCLWLLLYRGSSVSAHCVQMAQGSHQPLPQGAPQLQVLLTVPTPNSLFI